MAAGLSNIRTAVGLYRVSTRQQEQRGQSLFNQERSVRAWAKANDVKLLDEVRTAKSAKNPIRLVGGSLQLDPRAAYTRLIKELPSMPAAQRPDAIVIDWIDRWSRNLLEYVAIVKALQQLGVRMLAIGDGRDLTDPAYAMELQIRAAIAEEQLRITSGKVKEARRSRRERKLWQGGSPPDGYRTHVRDCAGPLTVERTGAEGSTAYRQRACSCRPDVLHIDPKREATLRYLWRLLETSPMSWNGIAEQMTEGGHRRPDGKPFRWNDVYRIGENPHYCGILATNRSIRDAYDGTVMRRRPLPEQGLVVSPEAIPQPYIEEAAFWSIWKRRFNKQTRHLTRAKNGASSELTGLVACPDCGSTMRTTYSLSSKICGNGKPRNTPRKKYVYLRCPRSSVVISVRESNCRNRQKVRADILSRRLIDDLARLVELSDDAVIKAMRLERRASVDLVALAEEKRTLVRTAKMSNEARHVLTKQLVAGVLTDAEFQAEMFRFRAEANECETRILTIDESMSRTCVRPDFDRARKTIAWLSDKWTILTVCERAEALRLFVGRVTYAIAGTPSPIRVNFLTAGPAFADIKNSPKNYQSQEDFAECGSVANLDRGSQKYIATL
jgi:DNA invertase Pin-like site-specific DNA recombinase